MLEIIGVLVRGGLVLGGLHLLNAWMQSLTDKSRPSGSVIPANELPEPQLEPEPQPEPKQEPDFPKNDPITWKAEEDRADEMLQISQALAEKINAARGDSVPPITAAETDVTVSQVQAILFARGFGWTSLGSRVIAQISISPYVHLCKAFTDGEPWEEGLFRYLCQKYTSRVEDVADDAAAGHRFRSIGVGYCTAVDAEGHPTGQHYACLSLR